ncbi:hypothetical protein KCV07_g125, partial [Aureobasidium melanogenum]
MLYTNLQVGVFLFTARISMTSSLLPFLSEAKQWGQVSDVLQQQPSDDGWPRIVRGGWYWTSVGQTSKY